MKVKNKVFLGIKILNTAGRYSNSKKKFLEDDEEEESEDEIPLNLLDSTLILHLCGRTGKYVSLQKESFKLRIVWNEMKTYLASNKKIELGHH